MIISSITPTASLLRARKNYPMTIRRHFALAAGTLLAIAATACCARPALAQTTYTLIDLGASSAHEFTSLNNDGKIAGKLYGSTNNLAVRIDPLDTNSDGKPDTWYQNSGGKNGLLKTLPQPKNLASVTEVGAINTAGDIAGGVNKRGTSLPQYAAVWQFPSTAVALSGSNEGSLARAINDNGDLGGWFRSGNGPLLPAVWSKGAAGYSRSLLGLLPGMVDGQVWSLNSAGQAAGWVGINGSSQRPMLWSAGQPPRDLSYPGDVRGSAQDINEVGQVLVSSSEPMPDYPSKAVGRIVLFTPDVPNSSEGSLTKLASPDPNAYFAPLALNNAAAVQIVGMTRLITVDPATGTGSDVPGSRYVFVWDAIHQYRNLNEWTENLPSGASITYANAINDNGLILAQYTLTASGERRECLLVPNL